MNPEAACFICGGEPTRQADGRACGWHSMIAVCAPCGRQADADLAEMDRADAAATLETPAIPMAELVYGGAR